MYLRKNENQHVHYVDMLRELKNRMVLKWNRVFQEMINVVNIFRCLSTDRY